ncbi:MAG: ImmA/IrrE family metallo-endopeptidase [Steroidobacteraceae bacterium]|nr:ImmA/IrrE family metallo-endopeptidase [Steroidobacteraceae bacterium]
MMSDWLHGTRVPPLSIADLRDTADLIRRNSGLSPAERFPVLPFLEWTMPALFENFDWEIVDALPDGDEARAYPDGAPHYPDGPLIQLTQSVYDQAATNNGRNGRARFTILHECGHVLLHQKVSAHRRACRGADLQPFENSEWQAHQFAAELLMPVASFSEDQEFNAYVTRMGVSREAACRRAMQLHRTMKKPVPRGWPVQRYSSIRRGELVMTA